MIITDRDWERLEADRHAGGVSFRRLHPDSAHDIRIAVEYPGSARMLTLRVTARDADSALRRMRIPSRTQGLEMQMAQLPGDVRELRIILTDTSLREVFNPLASDIAAAASPAAHPADVVIAAITRFEYWRRMLEKLADTGLPPEARRGLYGELRILRHHLLPCLSAAEAVGAWSGPTAANQDFQLPYAAIEVKTSAGKEPQALVVSNERELDDTGTFRLILAHLSLDERRGGTGESLNAAVDGTRAALADAAAGELLGSLLARAGYLQSQHHLYDEPRYTLRKERFFEVTGDFPRITESDLRPGVGDCRYRISTAGLGRYELSAQAVAASLTGRRPE